MLSLKSKPKFFRTGRAAVEKKVKYSLEGGKYGAGYIEGVSVITEGEALGHDMWIDGEFVKQVSDAMLAAGEKGIKSRFTHPGMSSDGLGKHLGRLSNPRIEGKQVIADLHFSKSAHNTPDGNLAEYVVLLVSDDPSAAGLSIVFEHDYEAMEAFAEQNETSPDKANTKNLPHVRMAKLRAGDVVDEPAANPNGMFDSMPIAREVDSALSWALGLSTEKPSGDLLGVDVDRAAAFLSRFLLSKGLEIVTKETKSEPTVEPVTREAFNAELARFVTKFGAENGTKWFTEQKTYQDALELHVEVLSERAKAAEEAAKAAEQKLASAQLGEKEPLPVAGSTATANKKTFAQAAGLVPSKN